MAFGNVYLYIFTALVAVNFIFADVGLDSVLSDDNQVDFSDSLSRDTRSAGEEADEPEPEGRFFFNLFPVVTTCNYTETPGLSCANCFQSVRCLANNNGILRNCRGLFGGYCNGGRCSIYPDPVACNGTVIG